VQGLALAQVQGLALAQVPARALAQVPARAPDWALLGALALALVMARANK
jgi:hypothetical protein